MPKSIDSVTMSPEQRRILETWIRGHNTPQGIVLRAKIVLLAADGLSHVQAAREVGVSRPTVTRWRQRFLQGGLDALTTIAPGRGRPATYTAEQVQRIVEATTQTKPPRVRPTGVPAAWRGLRASARLPCSVSGLPMGCNPTGRSGSSSPVTGDSPRSSPTWWGCTSIPPTRPSSCAWTKRVKSRPSSVPSPYYNCVRGR